MVRKHTGNYLRVRGEYHPRGTITGVRGELPPRTRRIPPTEYQGVFSYGTTSAYAENTAG